MKVLSVDLGLLEVTIHQGLERGGVSLRVEKSVELRSEVCGFFFDDTVGVVVEGLVKIRGGVVPLEDFMNRLSEDKRRSVSGGNALGDSREGELTGTGDVPEGRVVDGKDSLVQDGSEEV